MPKDCHTVYFITEGQSNSSITAYMGIPLQNGAIKRNLENKMQEAAKSWAHHKIYFRTVTPYLLAEQVRFRKIELQVPPSGSVQTHEIHLSVIYRDGQDGNGDASLQI